MALVLAIEPDPRQAQIVTRLVREGVRADLVVTDSKDAALAAIGRRVPDLLLITPLLSPRDETDLTGHLRRLEGASHLQVLTIPLLATPDGDMGSEPRSRLLGVLKRRRTPASLEGCHPSLFGSQIASYLRRAAELRGEAEPVMEHREHGVGKASGVSEASGASRNELTQRALPASPSVPPETVTTPSPAANELTVSAVEEPIVPAVEPVVDTTPVPPVAEEPTEAAVELAAAPPVAPETPETDDPLLNPPAPEPEPTEAEQRSTPSPTFVAPAFAAAESERLAMPEVQSAAETEVTASAIELPDLKVRPTYGIATSPTDAIAVEVQKEAAPQETSEPVVVERPACELWQPLTLTVGLEGELTLASFTDPTSEAAHSGDTKDEDPAPKTGNPVLKTKTARAAAHTTPRAAKPAAARPRRLKPRVKDPQVEVPAPPAPQRSVHDEWGIYDPQQCGFEALFAALEARASSAIPAAATPGSKATPLSPVRPARRAEPKGPPYVPGTAKAMPHRDTPKLRWGRASALPAQAAPAPGSSSLQRAAPLAMWVHRDEPPGATETQRSTIAGGLLEFGGAGRSAAGALHEPEWEAMLRMLSKTPQVGLIGYATGCRLRRVRVADADHTRPPASTRRRRSPTDAEPVIILSKKRLRELRAASAAAPVSACAS